MKKTFTFFAISALFLMLLFPVSVKADTTLSFIFESPNGGTDEDCNGNTINDWNAITTSDFHFSSKLYDEVKQQSSYLGKSWTSFKAGAKACTRQDVHLEAGSYTFTLKTTWMYGNNNTRVPIIRVNSQDYSLNNVNYPSNEEVDLEYTVSIPSTNDYPILITCVDGQVDNFCMRTLTITPNCTQHTVTVAADDNNKGTVAGGGSYCENSEVTVTATPNAGYNFVNWTDNNNSNAEVSTNASYTFTLTANVSYRANFAACEGAAVTVNRNNNDYGTVTGEGSYCAGSQVNLTATPNSSYRFVNWTVTSGVATLDDARSETTHFVMSDPATAVTIQANFEEDIKADRTYTYRAVEDNTGHNTNAEHSTEDYLYLTDGGHYIDFTHYSAIATTCTIKVGFIADNSKEFKVYVNDGQEKSDWTWNTTDGEKDMGMFNLLAGDNKISIVPSWTWFGIRYIKVIVNESKYTVTIANNNVNGNVTVDSPNFAGQIVNVSATPNSGYAFTGWTSSDVTLADATSATTTFTMPANAVTITANYEASVSNTFTYTAIGSGNISCATASGTNVSSGTEIELTATPDPDYTFTGWSSSDIIIADASANPLVFTMPANAVSVTANFEACTKHTVTLAANNGSYGSVDGGGLQCDGSVTVTATPNSGYRFVNWTQGGSQVSTNAEYTFTLSADISLTANFAQIDNVIITGDVASTDGFDGDGNGTMNITSVADFDAFNHNVLKFAYSNMSGGNYKGKKIFIDAGYSSSASAQATGFGFYYKTEKEDDHVAFCFEVSSGQQVKWQLAATNNEWKYFYFPHAGANSWNGGHIAIFMNGSDTGNYGEWNSQSTSTKYPNGGAFYMSEIAATSIISKDDIASYTYTRDITSNSYGTLCLPMAGSVSGATLYRVAGKLQEDGKLYIVLEEQGATLAAGEPYIFETDGSTLTATMSGPHSPVNEDANGLVGTYQLITAPAYSEPNDLNYVLALDDSNNTVFKRVGENVTVGAYRAYINIQNAVDYSPASAAPGRKYIRFGIEGTEEEQAVEMIYDDASLRTRKIMQNGHLYILRDGHLFTAQGTRIK
jgi:uncharacterized repeat protein (TIGR02543 family)